MVGAELLKLLGTLQVLCMCCAPRQGGTGRRVICAVLMYHTWVVLIVISQRMALSRNIPCLVGSYINVLCFLPFFNFFFFHIALKNVIPRFIYKQTKVWHQDSSHTSSKSWSSPHGVFVPLCVIVCRYVFRHQQLLIVYTLSPKN